MDEISEVSETPAVLSPLGELCTKSGLDPKDVATILGMSADAVEKLFYSPELAQIIKGLGIKLAILGNPGAINFWISRRRVEKLAMNDEARRIAGIPMLGEDRDKTINRIITEKSEKEIDPEIIARYLNTNCFPLNCNIDRGMDRWTKYQVAARARGWIEPLSDRIDPEQAITWQRTFVGQLLGGLMLHNPLLSIRYGLKIEHHELYYQISTTKPVPNCVRDIVKYEFQLREFLYAGQGGGWGEPSEAAIAVLMAPDPAILQENLSPDQAKTQRRLKRVREANWKRRQMIQNEEIKKRSNRPQVLSGVKRRPGRPRKFIEAPAETVPQNPTLRLGSDP